MILPEMIGARVSDLGAETLLLSKRELKPGEEGCGRGAEAAGGSHSPSGVVGP